MGFLQRFRQNFFFTYCNSFSFFVPHLHTPSPQVPQLSHFLYSTYLTVFHHNYLKQVYDSQAPKFAGSVTLHNAENKAQQSERSKKHDAFAYIEQMCSFGQPIEHLPYYKEWCEWKKQLQEER